MWLGVRDAGWVSPCGLDHKGLIKVEDAKAKPGRKAWEPAFDKTIHSTKSSSHPQGGRAGCREPLHHCALPALGAGKEQGEERSHLCASQRQGLCSHDTPPSLEQLPGCSILRCLAEASCGPLCQHRTAGVVLQPQRLIPSMSSSNPGLTAAPGPASCLCWKQETR